MFRNKAGDALEDLVQRTFLACLERTDRLEDPARFRRYLLATARNELYRFFRDRHGPRGRIDTMTTSVHELGPSPSSEYTARDERDGLLRALQMLPIDLQITLELYYWEGLRGPELAEVLDVPEGTVRSRLRVGRERLRQCLRELAVAEPSAQEAGDLDTWADALRERVGPVLDD